MKTQLARLTASWILLSALSLQTTAHAAAPPRLAAPPSVSAEQTTAPATTLRDPKVAAAQYSAVKAHLDEGGDLLLIASVDGNLKRLAEGLAQIIDQAMPEAPATNALRAAIEKLPGFLARNGFYAGRTFGISIVPRADGLHTLKSFVARDQAAADLPLWRALAGGKPRRLNGPDYLPADTVLARVTHGEPAELWGLIKHGVREIGGPKAFTLFNQRLMIAQLFLGGTPIDKLIESLGDESFFSIQLAADKTVLIPTQGNPITIPQPSFVLGIAVKDDTLMRAVERRLTNACPTTTSVVEGVQMRSAMLPPVIPFPMQPTWATHEGFFLLGSSAEALGQAIEARRQKNGLLQTEAFKKAFATLPMVNNGLLYASPQLGELIQSWQSREQPAQARHGLPQGEAFRALTSMMGRDATSSSSALVFVNLDDGLLTTGTTSSGGQDVMLSSVMAPIGMLAAIAIPNFVKARTTSQQNTCINNLRMIDSAKEQWAMAQNKMDGDEVDPDGIKEYMRGARIPVCPQGGTYTLGPVGTTPICNLPGHGMRLQIRPGGRQQLQTTPATPPQ